MDWTLQNVVLKKIFNLLTLGELLVLLTLYFGPKRRRTFVLEMLIILGLWVGLCLLPDTLRLFDIYEMILGLMLFTSIYSLAALRGEVLYKLAVCLYFCTTYFQLHSAELIFWPLVLDDPPFSRLFLAQLAMLLLLPLNRKLGAWHSEDTPRVYVFTLLLCSLLCMGICMATLPQLVPQPQYQAIALALCLGTLGMNMTGFYQGQQLMRAYREKMSLRAVADRIHADAYLMQEGERFMTQLRTQRHERANQGLVIRALCDAGDLAGLRAYVSQLFPQQEAAQVVDCGHVVASAVLTQKAAQADQAGVPMAVQAHLPPSLPISDEDLCSLIANLVQNALDASQQTLDPHVDVQLTCVKNYLSLRVSNRVQGDVLARNPRLTTTKSPREEHGVGIPVARSIVTRYDGMLDFSMEDDRFVAQALLKLDLCPARPKK